MDDNSIARYCIKAKEPIFYPNKFESAFQGKYTKSKRDERKGNGSVYCYPVITKNRDYVDRAVITFTTYGKFLCDPADEQEEIATKIVLNDICRRIDLELTLEGMKTWKFEYCRQQTDTGGVDD